MDGIAQIGLHKIDGNYYFFNSGRSGSAISADEMALINGLSGPSATVESGQMVKTVVK